MAFVRYASVILVAAVLAAVVALSVSAVEPERAEAASKVRTCGGGTIKLNAKEERTLRLHSRERRSRGLRALCVHPKLTKAARAHSSDMIKKDYFGHGSVGRRLKRHGYTWRVYGENIAGGTGRYASPGNAFRRWMNSSGHRTNILDRRFREIGIGTATGTYKGHRGYTMYTVDFGRRR
jgi:uncharacterized protein YkwD